MLKTKKSEPAGTKDFQVVQGHDGFPIPVKTPKTRQAKPATLCYCQTCFHNEAKLSLSKGGNYIIACSRCSAVVFIRRASGNRLLRAQQRVMRDFPDLLERYAFLVSAALLADDAP